MNTERKEYGSEFDHNSTKAYLTDNVVEHPLNSKPAYYFRSGRDALKAVAVKYSDSHKIALLPALCCEAMVTPFSMNGYEVSFYKLYDDCTADEADLKEKLSDECVVVYMSYFGIKPLTDEQLSRLKKDNEGAKFVEDRTHNPLHRLENNSFKADATVISLAKWFSVADGGLLYTDDDFEDEYLQDFSFSALRTEAMKMKSEYLNSGDEAMKKEFRAMLKEASELLDASNKAYKMTEQSKALLSRVNYDAILLQRQKNIRTLSAELVPLAESGKISFITDAPEKSTLYFPVIVKNRDDVQGRLAQRSLFCPVIWPLPKGAGEVCKNSKYIAENMLAIPCDQRYNENDMLKISQIIKQVLL